MKETHRKISAKGYDVKFSGFGDSLTATIIAGTKTCDRNYKLTIDFNFSCLPHIINDLRELWDGEHKRRVVQNARISAALGSTAA